MQYMVTGLYGQSGPHAINRAIVVKSNDGDTVPILPHSMGGKRAVAKLLMRKTVTYKNALVSKCSF